MATINGTNNADTLNGTTSADTINGLGGDDVIRGNGNFSGTDIIDGGAGNDTIFTGSGANNVRAGIGNDTLNGTNQTSFQDFFHGDDGDDIINGNGGRDFLFGDAGSDTIRTGIDTAASNGVGTTVSGGAGNDHIYSGGAISDLGGDAGNDTFHADQGLWTGSENYNGGADFDTILADASNTNIGINQITMIERIDGGAGNTNVDIQTSTATNPFLDLRGVELVNIDEIKGQGGNDFILLEGGAGTGNIALSRADVVRAGGGNDTIISGYGSDQIFGDAGNDTLTGGQDRDFLAGGTGTDTFNLGVTTDSAVGAITADQILDFSSADGDKIRLADIDADTSSAATNEAFSFVGSAAFSGVAGELRAETLSGITHVYGDVNADGAADFEIVLNNGASLSATDFIL
ncbi:calcium-binding protein [Rhizobium brockwellii]